MPDRPLSDLTDRDLLLNLWLSMTLAIEQFDIDEDSALQSLCRADDIEPAPPAGETTLAEIMAEIEHRLGIDTVEIETTMERVN